MQGWSGDLKFVCERWSPKESQPNKENLKPRILLTSNCELVKISSKRTVSKRMNTISVALRTAINKNR